MLLPVSRACISQGYHRKEIEVADGGGGDRQQILLSGIVSETE